MRRLALLIAAASIVLASVSVPHLSAQSPLNDSLNITTSPLPISLNAKPGETVTTELRVKNNGINSENLRVGLMKFSAFGDEGKPMLEDAEITDSYFEWVKFSQNQFVALPNEWNSIKMNISVPDSAAFGYYYAVIFERASTSDPVLPTGLTGLKGGSATLVLLNVDVPGAKRELGLISFESTKKTFEFLPASFTVKLRNTGNTHVAPTGTIYISKGGSVIDTIPVNSTKGNILPDSGRSFGASWENGFPLYEDKISGDAVVYENNVAQQTLSWKFNNIKNFRFGKYNAHLTMVYDDGTRDVPLDADVSFWVIPWRLIAVMAGVPLAVVALIIYLIISRRQFKKRAHGVKTWRR